MLRNLSIENIVFIEQLQLHLEPGFIVLTGETGAGKSIILDALGLALGYRSESRLLRQGAEKGTVIAEFDNIKNPQILTLLKEQDIDYDGHLILRRSLYQDGRTRAFINDVAVSVGFLREIADALVTYHGQHAQHGLLQPSTHRDVLDQFADTEALLTRTSENFSRWKKSEEILSKLEGALKASQDEEDFLQAAVDELTKLNPQTGEETKLTDARKKLQQQGKAQALLTQFQDILQGDQSVLTRIYHMQRQLRGLEELIGAGAVEPISTALDRASNECSDALAAVEKELHEFDELGSLEAIEDRLFALRAAARKYHKTSDELAAYRAEMQARLEQLSHRDEDITNARQERDASRAAYLKAANELSETRCNAGRQLVMNMKHELKPLKMGGTTLDISVSKLPESEWGEKGWDKILFQVQTNPGAPIEPLNKIASGGELSRFMLALEVALRETHATPTIIFDEIDTGIGGATAEAVGKRLKDLGSHCQVIAITHQPQVAAIAHHHLKVAKTFSKGHTYIGVSELDDTSKKEEVARMIAGQVVTDAARAAASELMGS